ncbi:hypothetical protein MMC26_006390 [Xylographa opegraphella]|nr:hypothetical protein [Xylographa opegraphella]
MGQGFFGYNPPDFVLRAAEGVVEREDCNQYAPTKGRPRLREALAKTFSPLLSRTVDAQTEVVVTTGANEGILCAIMAFVEPGDEVIVMEPFFSYYARAIILAGGTPQYVSLKPPADSASRKTRAAEWKLDLEEVNSLVNSKTRAMILNSPHNPIGKTFSREELQGLADICVKHSIIVISDEVYDRLSFVPFTRIAQLSPEIWNLTLTVGSAGKTFYATGWRVGFLIGPKQLIEGVVTAHRGICFATPNSSQEALAIAYEEAEREGFWKYTKECIEAKMHRFNEIWDELGIPYVVPDGGYFVLVNTKRIVVPDGYIFPAHITDQEKDIRLAWFLIYELGVASVPISEFYCAKNKEQGSEYLRFSVCHPDGKLDLAKTRLRGLKKFMS